MTIEEVISLVKECGFNIETTKHFECEKIVLSALEKQIPKKVTDIHLEEYYCPACGAENNKDWSSNRGDDYCPDCGQALDWGG